MAVVRGRAAVVRGRILAGCYCTSRTHSWDGTRRDENGDCPKCEMERLGYGPFGEGDRKRAEVLWEKEKRRASH